MNATTQNRCPYCRVQLDEVGNIVHKDARHAPSCADRPLKQSELKKLLRNRRDEPEKVKAEDPDTGRVEFKWLAADD